MIYFAHLLFYDIFIYTHLNKLTMYPKYITSNSVALFLVIVFFFQTWQNILISIIEKANNIKLLIKDVEKVNGVIIAPVPNIKKEFKIHEPIKFPVAKSSSFFIIAIIDVINSGKAVPIAIIVEPITLSGIPNFKAISVADSTTQFPPVFKSSTPNTIKNVEDKIFLFLYVFSYFL